MRCDLSWVSGKLCFPDPRFDSYIGSCSVNLRKVKGWNMERKKISTTVYITPMQNDNLKLLNQKTKVPIAEYIREGIDMVLEKYRNQLPGQLSLLGDETNLLTQPHNN